MRDTPQFRPLYQQIKDLMLQALNAGEWQSGAMIPSEHQLAKRFHVSQGTVRKAIDELSAENILLRKQGKGTYVATHDDPHSFYRFLRLSPDVGEINILKSTPLTCECVEANEQVAERLQLPTGALVYYIKRVLSDQGIPVVYDEIYLPKQLFDNINVDIIDNSSQSLYSIFESKFGVRMIRASEKIRAVLASTESSKYLAVKQETPLLQVDRIAYTYENKPVEWRRGVYLTQNHHYANELY